MAGYKIPKPFQDEDKYLRYFTKKQILYIGAPIALTVFVVIKLWDAPTPILFTACVLCVSLIFACILFSSVKMPKDKYLWGGGTALEKLGLRLIKKQNKEKKILWVKNYGEHEEEVKERKIKNPLDVLFNFSDEQ